MNTSDGHEDAARSFTAPIITMASHEFMGETLAALAAQRRTSVAMTQVPRERGGVAFSADGKVLAWIANSNAVVLVDVDLALTGKPSKRGLISSPVPITSVAFAPCGLPLPAWKKDFLNLPHSVCTTHANGSIRLWNSLTLELLTTLLSHVADVTGLCFATDSNFNLTLYTVSIDKTLKVWDLEDAGFNMSRTVKHAHPLLTCSLSEKTKLLAAAGTGMKVFVYRLDSMHLEHVLLGHCDNIVCCKFSPDGTVLASSSQDTKIFLWDAITGQLRITLCSIYPMSKFSLVGNHSMLYSKDIEFDCFGSSIVSVSPNMKIRLWEASRFSNSTACEEYSVFPGQLLDDDGSESAACALDRTNSLLALCSSHKLQVFRVRPRLPRLAHLCRSAIRRSNYLAFLDQLPPTMQRYVSFLPERETSETLNPELVCNILAQAERELSQRQIV